MKRVRPHPDAELQHIADTPDIEIGEILHQVEVDPDIFSRLLLNKDMVAPYVAVTQAMVV